MRRKALALGAAVAVTVGVAVLLAGPQRATSTPQAAPANTAAVEQGALSAMVSQAGTLTYRARPDGSPYTAVNQARGTYTRLPEAGDEVGCGDVLYRVDERPVLLLCGTVPAYRDLRRGDRGKDVRQLNRNLRVKGNVFSAKTRRALKRSALELGDAVFLPEPARIAKVTAELGGPARPGTVVLQATSDTLHVQVALDPSRQRAVKQGDRAQITLPGNAPVSGKVEGFGRVARTAEQDGKPADATIPTSISLDEPEAARGLDRAPVQVDITTDGVEDALSVPVVALVGKSGGGFAVEVVRAGGARELVAVRLGLFDTAGGRVQVEGGLHAGDRVVVPSL